MPKAPICTACASLNAAKRDECADLTGATALVTSRFPCCAALRFSSHPEAQEDWGKRLHIYGIDLRHLKSLDCLCEHLAAQYTQLDIIVHNAAQTVRRPPAYYSEMFDQESKLVSECLSG